MLHCPLSLDSFVGGRQIAVSNCEHLPGANGVEHLPGDMECGVYLPVSMLLGSLRAQHSVQRLARHSPL